MRAGGATSAVGNVSSNSTFDWGVLPVATTPTRTRDFISFEGLTSPELILPRSSEGSPHGRQRYNGAENDEGEQGEYDGEGDDDEDGEYGSDEKEEDGGSEQWAEEGFDDDQEGLQRIVEEDEEEEETGSARVG